MSTRLDSKFAREFAPLYERWRADIFVFAKEALNFEPTAQQAELLRIVQLECTLPLRKRKKRIAVKSGQGPGKTAVSVVIALYRLLRYPDSLVIVTSPTLRQCKQWIDEAKRVIKKGHPILRRFVTPYTTKIEVNGVDIWAIKTATASRPENLQGIHEEHLTFIGDEASGIARSIIETIMGTLSNPDSLFLLIGNPNTSDCAFYECFNRNRHLWWTLTFNAEDTARDYPHIVSPDRNRQLEDEFGRDSDVYRVRVLGEFPIQDPNSVMGMEDLEACTRTDKVGCSQIRGLLNDERCISIDYARYGGDESTVAVRLGTAIMHFKAFSKVDPRETTDYAFQQQYLRNWRNKDVLYVPDAGGMGQGIIHSFYEAGKRVVEFHTQGTADDAMFADQYTQAWWSLRRLVVERICHLPNDARLLKQLGTRQYYMDRKGRIKVESKDEWRKRLQTDESPDRADGVVMAFYKDMNTGGRFTGAAGSGRTVGTSITRKR